MSGLPEHLQLVYDVVFYVTFNFVKALTAFLQRDSYLYWPFLLSTLVVAALVARLAIRAAGATGGVSWTRRFRDYFSPRIWWHASARADYRLYFVNALVLPALFGWLLFSDAQVGALLDAALGREAIGTARPPGGIAERLLFTLLFFIAYDFGRFVAHSLLHDVPALWEFHKVHHSAQVLTWISAYRAHPVELLIMAWVPALFTGLATWLFNLAMPVQVGFYTFMGLHAVLWAVNLVDNLRHSHVWLTYGRRLGRWIVSPAHHQLHHSFEPRHMGCNRGFTLAVWDRIYGTLYVPSGPAEEFRMGLGDGTDEQWNNVRRMYFRPLVASVQRLGDLLRGRKANPQSASSRPGETSP